MKNATQKFKRNVQGGFTLIELVVVVAIVGILIAMLAPSILGTKNNANAALLSKTAQNVSNNWMLISQSCGTTTDATAGASPVVASGKTLGDVIFGGSANVETNYQACYKQAHVLAMSDAGQPKSGGGWTVAGYEVEFAGGGTAPFKTIYKKVPDDLVLMMASKYTPSLSALDASDTTSTVIQYGSATAGVRDVTVLRVVN